MTADDFPFAVDSKAPIAVYVQVENLIRFAIAAERLKPGDALPSVREMSERLGINPNTVTKAYRDLEITGIVTTRRGVGVTIADKAVSKCATAARAMAARHLEVAVAECAACGFDATQIQTIVDKTVASGRKPYEA